MQGILVETNGLLGDVFTEIFTTMRSKRTMQRILVKVESKGLLGDVFVEIGTTRRWNYDDGDGKTVRYNQ
jgi:hypothetical protein